MKSRTTKRFREAFSNLPVHIQKLSELAYKKWKSDPVHPGLQFKKIHQKKPVYSVRICLGYRAVGIMQKDTLIWFWIGSHSEYNRIISTIQ